jgi:DNA-binding MarR family transcriptional regulator
MSLRHLGRQPDASLHDLAQLTFETDQSFGSLSSRMVERGLIERVPGPGRAVRHRLTDRGEELREAGDALAKEVVTGSFAPLTAGRLEQLGDLLDQVLEPPAAPA